MTDFRRFHSLTDGAPAAGFPVCPAAAIGPVGADRIALVRRRIAIGRYPIDAMALAGELLRCGPWQATEMTRQASIFLADAISRIESALAMVLQLLYCEQLGPSGTGAVLGWPQAQVETTRQAALIRLTLLLDEEAARLMLPRAASR